MDPQFFLYTYGIQSNAAGWVMWGTGQVRARANLIQAESVLETAALDKYTFIRDAWLQRRRSQVYDGNPPRPKDDN